MHIEPISIEALSSFSPHKDDIREAEAMNIDWQTSLWEAVFDPETVVVVNEGHTLAVGGNNGDQCWFVVSELMDGLSQMDRYCFRNAIIDYRDKVWARYETLWNYVWTGNKGHIKFMQSIGATFHKDDTLVSPTGETFMKFTLKRR